MSWQEGEWSRSYSGVCCRVGSRWGWQGYRAEAGVHNKLAEVWVSAESDSGRLDEEVLGGLIRGEDVEAFSKDLFESVDARIIGSGEGNVMGVTGGVGGGVGVMGSSG